jgi:acyl-CoA thioesterase I
VRQVTRHLLLSAGVAAALVGGCSQTKSPSTDSAESAQQTTAAAGPSTAAPADGNVRYLALGDSLTQGVGAPDEQTGAFPALLAERWRADGCEVELQNAGISGYTAGQILAEQVPQIESFAPTIVTFQAGGNDIANGVPIDEYRGNVKAVLDRATASGARVIVLAQNEWFRSPVGVDYGEDVPAQRAAYDDVLIEETSAHGAEFVDLRPLYAEQADQDLWVEDGIHPTPDAYEAWAEKLTDAVPAPCK